MLNDALVAARKQASAQKIKQYQSADGIVRFACDILGVNPAPYQEEILRHFVTDRRVAVRGPHGLGKTAMASWCVLWMITVFQTDVKVVTTASVWRQLTKYLWPEIRKWAAHAKWHELGMEVRHNKELLTQSLKIGDKEAFPVASNDPALIEGAHASVVSYIFDEAKSIPDVFFDAAEGAFSIGEAYVLMISTPGNAQGRFYDIHARKVGFEDWWVRHVTDEEAIAAGRMNPQWREQRRRQWGAKSPMYKTRVEGEFAANADEVLIPLAWVEASHERWRERRGKGDGVTSYGLDVARYGDDKTVIARLRGHVLEELRVFEKQSTMQTVGHMQVAARRNKQARIGVDVIGMGGGPVDRLRELGYQCVYSFNAAASTPLTDLSGEMLFVNLRSAFGWALREALDPEGGIRMALPPHDDLTADLTTPKWGITSSGKLWVESKEDIRKRLGRSTDYMDATMIALYAANPIAEQEAEVVYDESMRVHIGW